MNDQIIRELAATLGVTVEHLWDVLITQAPISGTVGLTGLMVITAVAVWFTRLVYKKTSRIKDADGFTLEYPQWDEEVWFGVGMIWIFTFWIYALGLVEVIAAFFNPEYWALMKVLNKF